MHCLVLKAQRRREKKEKKRKQQKKKKSEIKSGDNSVEEPPVPMPNTEVKLNSVDGT